MSCPNQFSGPAELRARPWTEGKFIEIIITTWNFPRRCSIHFYSGGYIPAACVAKSPFFQMLMSIIYMLRFYTFNGDSMS